MASRVLEGASQAPPWWAKFRTRRSNHRLLTALNGSGSAAGDSLAAMLDHVFLDAVRALSGALDEALLERRPHDDRLAADILSAIWSGRRAAAFPARERPRECEPT